jgi:hypothetical protein
MKFQGAVIKEQGVTFAVAIVKKQIIDNRSQAVQAIKSFQPLLASVPLQAIPWKEYTIS